MWVISMSLYLAGLRASFWLSGHSWLTIMAQPWPVDGSCSLPDSLANLDLSFLWRKRYPRS